MESTAFCDFAQGALYSIWGENDTWGIIRTTDSDKTHVSVGILGFLEPPNKMGWSMGWRRQGVSPQTVHRQLKC